MNNIIAVIIGIVILFIAGFIALQFKSFKQWLVYACCEAENYFKSNTGQLKLRYVYNLAVNSKFGFIIKIVSFNMFSKFVDSALTTMRKMIDNNETIAKLLTDVQVVDIKKD